MMPRTLPPPTVSDTDLLRRFAAGRDEAAFELLVWRYRGLVANVCRRVLGNPHDAEDAAQAAFLVLARKAANIRGKTLAAWLSRVAFRCAVKVRRSRRPFAVLPDIPACPPPEPLDAHLDAELDRLPEKYRTPMVLCYLHGLSYAEASERLNCPTGTLCGWLTRGKALLRKRLLRRGVAVPAGVFAAYLGGLVAGASALHQVRELTTVAVAFAAGETPPGPAAAIAHGVLSMMSFKRVALVALGSLAVALGGFTALIAADAKKPADEPKAATVPVKPSDIDRAIGQEPKYAGTPMYCLLAFDAEAKQRVWLVHDGDTLYVDKNGNGDLTDDGEKVAGQKLEGRDGGVGFTVGDVTVGGQTYTNLTVGAYPLMPIAESPDWSREPRLQTLVKKDPKALGYGVAVEVKRAGLKGAGKDGRLQHVSGVDSTGYLQFAPTRADAPVIHYGGRLELAFEQGEPPAHTGQDVFLRLNVGSPGFGPGTFAAIPHDNNIPDGLKPVAEVTYPVAKPGDPPRTEVIPLPGRC
ncbi:MAG: RNA polymerase sigma factor [Fimbriiglobus sp.]|nr:RNA polymerase sigma factor [Fimbriiglobus sp.]